MHTDKNIAFVFRVERGKFGDGVHIMTACMQEQHTHVTFMLETENATQNLLSVLSITPCNDSCLVRVGHKYDFNKKNCAPFETKKILQALEEEREGYTEYTQLAFSFPQEKTVSSLAM